MNSEAPTDSDSFALFVNERSKIRGSGRLKTRFIDKAVSRRGELSVFFPVFMRLETGTTVDEVLGSSRFWDRAAELTGREWIPAVASAAKGDAEKVSTLKVDFNDAPHGHANIKGWSEAEDDLTIQIEEFVGVLTLEMNEVKEKPAKDV